MPLFSPDFVSIDGYPEIEPSLRLDFANARALDPRITFTRASTATYVGRDGLIKYAGEDEARFDHDPTTGESLGLLIEESRTNEISYSEDVSNAAWSKNNSNIQSNSIVSPSGDTTADKVFDDSTVGATHSISQSFGKAAILYTGSVYAKAGEYTKVALGFVGVSNWDGIPQALFDLSTGQVTSVGVGGPTANITAVGNGWYRCSLTAESLNTTSSGLSIGIISDSGTNVGGGNIFLGHDGDGSSGLYIWGAQVEAGSFPTSYIPTSGSTATRAVDDAVISGESFNSFFNPSEGTVICKYKKDHWPVAAGNIYFERVWEIGNGSDASNLNIFNDPTQTSGNNIRYRVRTNSTNVFGPLTTSTGSNQTPTVALGYAKDNFALAIDGTLVDTDTSGDLPAVDRLHIGGRYGGDSFDRFNNTISKLIYYPKRLTNTQLQTLTQ